MYYYIPIWRASQYFPMEKQSGLGPEFYDKEYYLKSLPGLEYLRKGEVDPAILDTIKIGSITSKDHVLDFGCGRGNLAMELARRGSKVVGIDFSRDAIEFAEEYLKQFPEDIQKRVHFQHATIEKLNAQEEFDVIIFNQVYEHLQDWELERLMAKFKRALKSSGRLVISTPNLNYIRYLYPLKRILEFPFKIIKEILRVFRGKSKHASSLRAFLKEILKIRYPESEHTRLHINLQTPSSIKEFMEKQGFRAQVECMDPHMNLLSLVTRKWWGETIWLSCRST